MTVRDDTESLRDEFHKATHKQAQTELPDPFPGEDMEYPWRDSGLLRKLYKEEMYSMNQIRKGWDCSLATVGKWIDEHGIEKRTRSQAAQNMHGNANSAAFRTRSTSRECWRHLNYCVLVHRLFAVAEWGFEAVANMEVHHKNDIPWDNRAENLVLLTKGEHSAVTHSKVSWLDKIRVAEMYEHGDISSRKLGAMFDVTQGPVLRYHSEGYKA